MTTPPSLTISDTKLNELLTDTVFWGTDREAQKNRIKNGDFNYFSVDQLKAMIKFLRTAYCRYDLSLQGKKANLVDKLKDAFFNSPSGLAQPTVTTPALGQPSTKPTTGGGFSFGRFGAFGTTQPTGTRFAFCTQPSTTTTAQPSTTETTAGFNFENTTTQPSTTTTGTTLEFNFGPTATTTPATGVTQPTTTGITTDTTGGSSFGSPSTTDTTQQTTTGTTGVGGFNFRNKPAAVPSTTSTSTGNAGFSFGGDNKRPSDEGAPKISAVSEISTSVAPSISTTGFNFGNKPATTATTQPTTATNTGFAFGTQPSTQPTTTQPTVTTGGFNFGSTTTQPSTQPTTGTTGGRSLFETQPTQNTGMGMGNTGGPITPQYFPSFKPTEENNTSTNTKMIYYSITKMDPYKDKSFEEWRWYFTLASQGKLTQNPFSTPTTGTTTGGFGQTQQPSSSFSFGNTITANTSFGNTITTIQRHCWNGGPLHRVGTNWETLNPSQKGVLLLTFTRQPRNKLENLFSQLLTSVFVLMGGYSNTGFSFGGNQPTTQTGLGTVNTGFGTTSNTGAFGTANTGFAFAQHNTNCYSFRCDDGEGKFIEMQLLFSEPEHLITLSCIYNYHKYLFREEPSSIIHFKYFKTCLMNNSFTCKASDDIIILVVKECSDDESTIKFILDKQERDYDEKMNIMFKVMMKDIKELKEKLWFSDRDLDKFSEKYVTNWKSLFPDKRSNLNKKIQSSEKKEYYVNTTGFKIKIDSFKSKTKGYSEEDLEPILIYFKQKVEFSRIEIFIEGLQVMGTPIEKIKVYVFGAMKPQGVIRKLNRDVIYDLNQSSFQALPGKEELFIMPKLQEIAVHECYAYQLVSIILDSKNSTYDGIGIAVRKQTDHDTFSYTISNLRIY